MDYPLPPFVNRVTSYDFSLNLQLLEGPPTSLTAGFSDWKQMYQMAIDCGDLNGAAVGVQNLFSIMASNGHAMEALLCANRMCTIGAEAADPLICAHGITNIGHASWVAGDHITAQAAAREALRVASHLGPKPIIHPFLGAEAIKASATELLLTLNQARGELRRSISDHDAMLQVHRGRGNVLGAVGSMESLGNACKALGEDEEALRWLTQALEELGKAEVPDPRWRLLTRAGLLGNIGVVLTKLARTEEALSRIQEAFEIYTELSDSFGQISTHGQKGRALLRAGRVEDSLLEFDVMLQLARRFDSHSWQHAAHLNLARACFMTGNRVDGIEHCERAIAIAAEKLEKGGSGPPLDAGDRISSPDARKACRKQRRGALS